MKVERMSFINQITEMQLDVLKEIGNIGAGNAATALSKLLNKKIEMKIPSARVLSFEEMMEMAGGSDQTVASVYLRIEGDATGSMFFILPLHQVEHSIQQLFGSSSLPYDECDQDIAASALQELGNILTGSYISSLANFTNLSLVSTVPTLSIDLFGAIISYGFIELSKESDVGIVIDTALKEDAGTNTESIKGYFFLIPDPNFFTIIFNALGISNDD